jgi:hypothetical protein
LSNNKLSFWCLVALASVLPLMIISRFLGWSLNGPDRFWLIAVVVVPVLASYSLTVWGALAVVRDRRLSLLIRIVIVVALFFLNWFAAVFFLYPRLERSGNANTRAE